MSKIKLSDCCKWVSSHSSYTGVALLRRETALQSWRMSKLDRGKPGGLRKVAGLGYVIKLHCQSL